MREDFMLISYSICMHVVSAPVTYCDFDTKSLWIWMKNEETGFPAGTIVKTRSCRQHVKFTIVSTSFS